MTSTDDPQEDEEKRGGSRTARQVRRAGLLLVTFLILNHLVLPQLAGARNALHTLSDVNPGLLLVALALELGALAAYAQFTRAALPPQPHLDPSKPRLSTILRIQLATKAVTNLIPGGTAAGSAVGYRLLVGAGVAGSDAAFALATVGLASAVVLNVLLWLALVVSIPRGGFQPAYLTAAIVGVILLTLFAALVVLLMKGRRSADRAVRAITRRLPFVHPDKASDVLHRIADHLHALAERPDVVRGGVGWAMGNWLLDAASLWVFLAAFGSTVPIDSLLVSFCLASVLAVIPLTPGGLGVVEAVLTSTLVGFGVPAATAAVGVVTYRLAAFWLPIPLGALSYASLRVGPAPLGPRPRRRVRELAEDAFEAEARLAARGHLDALDD